MNSRESPGVRADHSRVMSNEPREFARASSWLKHIPDGLNCSSSQKADTAPGQTFAKSLPGPGEPPLDRADWPAQLIRGFTVGLSLEIAEYQRQTITIRQSIQLFTQQGGVRVVKRIYAVDRLDFLVEAVRDVSLGRLGPRLPRDADGYSMQ